MLKRFVFLLCLVGAAAPLWAQESPSAPSTPPPPEVIAQRCIERNAAITQHTVTVMHARTNDCLERIAALLEDGLVQQAVHAGRQGIESLHALARQAINQIGNNTRHCVKVLTDLEAPQELIDQVQTAAQANVRLIQERKAAEIARIQEALPPPPG